MSQLSTPTPPTAPGHSPEAKATSRPRQRPLTRRRLLTALLVLGDAIVFATLWLSMYNLRDWLGTRTFVPINSFSPYATALVIYLPFWTTVVWYNGLYDHMEKVTGLNELTRILKAFLSGTVGALAIAYLFKPWDIGRFVLLATALGYFLWLYGSRSGLRVWKTHLIRRGVGVVRVAIIGLGRTARRVADRLQTHPEGGYRLVGYIDSHTRRRTSNLSGIPVIGTISDLAELVDQHQVDEVFLAVPKMSQHETLNLVLKCEDAGVQFKMVSNLFQVITRQARIDTIDEVPVVRLRNAGLPPLQAALKRAMDIIVAGTLLLIFGVPMIFIAAFIRLGSRGPAFFRQIRIGQGGKPFTLLKFRTMLTETNPYAEAPVDPADSRITPMGRWLRKTSLDELPQLFNVLRGHMSMVGPRPEMPFLVERYEPWQRRRLDVKPGVTGLWQVVGRKNLPLALNMEYDFYYIMNQSLFLDLVILVKTVPAVIFGRGAF